MANSWICFLEELFVGRVIICIYECIEFHTYILVYMFLLICLGKAFVVFGTSSLADRVFDMNDMIVTRHFIDEVFSTNIVI